MMVFNTTGQPLLISSQHSVDVGARATPLLLRSFLLLYASFHPPHRFTNIVSIAEPLSPSVVSVHATLTDHFHFRLYALPPRPNGPLVHPSNLKYDCIPS